MGLRTAMRIAASIVCFAISSASWMAQAQPPPEPSEPEPSTPEEPPPEETSADVQACLSASELGQDLRDKTQLIQARASFLQCSREVCPKVVRDDCMQWMNTVDNAIPSIVPAARDKSGHDMSAVSF